MKKPDRRRLDAKSWLQKAGCKKPSQKAGCRRLVAEGWMQEAGRRRLGAKGWKQQRIEKKWLALYDVML